ncbi:MAG: hypothetical protein FJ126_06645 [Deltaproteobacteria bacterium]|nr:hypothetical protein [Deltaproteobacteria bacterium]
MIRSSLGEKIFRGCIVQGFGFIRDYAAALLAYYHIKNGFDDLSFWVNPVKLPLFLTKMAGEKREATIA